MNARPLRTCGAGLAYTTDDDGIWLVCVIHGEVCLGFNSNVQDVIDAEIKLCKSPDLEVTEEEIKLIHPDYPTHIGQLDGMYEDHAKRVKIFYAAD